MSERASRGRVVLATACLAVAVVGSSSAVAAAASSRTAVLRPTRAETASLAPTANRDNPGCGNMIVWQPKITSGFSPSMSPAEKEDLAPGNFSPEGKLIFGNAVAQLLQGHHVTWLSGTVCRPIP